MWGCNGKKIFRHFWGHQAGNPLAICGAVGEYPLDYTQVELPRCEKCERLWPRYGKAIQTFKPDIMQR